MHITQHDDGERGEFIVQDGDTHVGELSYVWTDAATLTIHHTGVIDAYKGQGIARQLLHAAVAFAREKNAQIVPVCSYVKAVFERDKKLGDVWHKTV